MKFFRRCDYSKGSLSVSQYYFLWYCLSCCIHKMVLTFESVDKIVKCDHSNVANAVLFCGAVYYAVKSVSNFLDHE